jgi:fucose permease
MPGFHASWSIGAFAGAGIGALGVAAGLSLSRQLALLAVPVLVVAGSLTFRMLADPPPAAVREQAGRRPAAWLSRPVVLLGAIAFASMLCEGASADWASVYLRGSLHTGPAAAGLGYTAFALAMVVVRLSGNRLLTRFPRHRLLPFLAVAAAGGFTAGLLGGRAATVVAGFAFLGGGLALVVPSVNSASGRLPGLSQGTAIAMVSAFGWAGFVCGPPVIGQLASASSLTVALLVLPVLTAVIAVATARIRALRPAPDPAATRTARCQAR